MTCQDVASHLAEGGRLPAEVERHLRECDSCRRLSVLADSSEVSQATQNAIQATIKRSLKAVHAIPNRGVLALGFLAIFGLVSAGFALYLGAQGAAEMTWLQLAGVFAAIVITAVLASFSLSAGMVPGERPPISTLKLSVGFGAGLAVLAGALFPWESAPGWAGMTWHCFSTGFGLSIAPAGLVVLLLSRGAPQSWGTIGAGAGLLAGLVGLATVHLGCIMHTAGHVATGHALIPLACALAGFGLGRIAPLVTSASSARRSQRGA